MTLLKIGSKGAAVRALQEDINKAKLVGGKLRVDGVYGDGTEKAVRHMQALLGLVVDGKAGNMTLKALRQLVTPAKTTARVEPDKSAMAVAPEPERITRLPSRIAPPPNVDTLKLYDTARPIVEIIIHCTATPEGKNYTVEDVRAWHKQRGFSDIGYHYLIYPDGRIMLGRPIGQTGSHVQGHNTGTIGISYFGGVAKDGKTAKDTRTPEQRSSLLWLTDQLARKFHVKRITGHNKYAAKACPSFNVAEDQLSELLAA